MFAKIKAFFQKLWALCLKSATILLGYLTIAATGAGVMIDDIGKIFGDPNLKQQFETWLQANFSSHTQLALTISGALGLLMLLARMRSILFGSKT